jgi:hypothetical protein
MTTCGASRLLVPAFLVGFAVASVTGTDVYGWLAAGLTVAVLLLTRTARGGGGSCAVQLPAAPEASTGGREVDRPEELPAP